MRKLIYLLPFVLIANLNFAQEYETIVDTTKQWSVIRKLFCYLDEPPYQKDLRAYTISYRFRGDTLINDYHYKFLEECNDSLFQNWYRSKYMLRDDSADRVYIHDYSIERLLYDYNIEKGDTIMIPICWDFTQDVIKDIFVDTVMYVDFAGKNRKRISSKRMVVYTKGYGTSEGPLGILYIDLIGDYYDYVSCFKQNDSLLFSNGDNCYVQYDYTDINEVKDNLLISIYPNPANNIVTIKTHNNQPISKINIYTLQGKLLLTDMVEENLKTIQINSLTSGIYLIETIVKNQTVNVQKLIIKKQ